MDLNLKNQRFLVCGAGSGFGKAIAETLCKEGAFVSSVSRSEEPMKKLQASYPHLFSYITGDLRETAVLDAVSDSVAEKTLHGAVINAGGPPAKGALDTTMNDWDAAYQLVLRWKIDLVSRIVPKMTDQGYGRILFIESQSVKQPIPNLVLSNAMRMAVVGYAKTLSGEVASKGVTVNVLAPGSHNTPAIERIVTNRSESAGITPAEARKRMELDIPVGRMGTADEIASLAAWILSGHAGFVTGQTVSHDGGNIAGVFG
ncbi:MAG: SDR family oxidoreductase [Rhodothermaceae bacterium]|nr:SDR family oxidoreductase [Rhodothermaceae bacterium]